MKPATRHALSAKGWRRPSATALLLVCAACGGDFGDRPRSVSRDALPEETPPQGAVVLLVNGEPLFDSAVRAWRDRLAAESPGLPESELARAAQEKTIEEALIRQEAAARGIEVSADEVSARFESFRSVFADQMTFYRRLQAIGGEQGAIRREIRDRLLRDRLLESEPGFQPASETEIRDYYDRFLRDASVELAVASHILRATSANDTPADREVARRDLALLREEIAAGEVPFSLAARRSSDDPFSALLEGDLGLIGRGQFPELDAALFGTPLRQVSEVVESRYGYHLILVAERFGPGAPPFELLADRIEHRINRERGQRVSRALLDRLRREASVELPAVSAHAGG